MPTDTTAAIAPIAALKTATTAALCRTERHDDDAPFRPQMERFLVALNSDDTRLGKVLLGPADYAEYSATFSSDAKRVAFGAQRATCVNIKQRERKEERADSAA